jgi:hypothetical protein
LNQSEISNAEGDTNIKRANVPLKKVKPFWRTITVGRVAANKAHSAW